MIVHQQVPLLVAQHPDSRLRSYLLALEEVASDQQAVLLHSESHWSHRFRLLIHLRSQSSAVGSHLFLQVQAQALLMVLQSQIDFYHLVLMYVEHSSWLSYVLFQEQPCLLLRLERWDYRYCLGATAPPL